MLVEIRPLDKNKWHGLKGDKAFTRDITCEAFVSRHSGQYDVRFTSEEERQHLEKVLGVDLSLSHDPGRAHPTWSRKSFWATLPNNTKILNTEVPMQAVELAILKGAPLVANSMKEYNEGKWPDATHVIFSEEEEMEIKASKIETIKKAFQISLEMSREQKIQLITILSTDLPFNVREHKDSFIEVRIKDLIDENPREFVKWATMDKETLAVRSLVLEANHKGALMKQGPSYFYGGERIGIDIDDAVSFLKDPENREFRARLMEKIGL